MTDLKLCTPGCEFTMTVPVPSTSVPLLITTHEGNARIFDAFHHIKIAKETDTWSMRLKNWSEIDQFPLDELKDKEIVCRITFCRLEQGETHSEAVERYATSNAFLLKPTTGPATHGNLNSNSSLEK